MRHSWIYVPLLAVATGGAVLFFADRSDVQSDSTGRPVIADSSSDWHAPAGQRGVTAVAEFNASNEAEERYYSGYSSDASFNGGNTTAKMPHSAMERAMLSSGMINEAALTALESKDFNQVLTRFEDEQGGMTRELTAAYRAVLERSLDSIPAAKKIDRLVCGTDLCIASIRSPTQEWYDGWFDSVQRTSALPMNSLTGKSFNLGGSGVEYRVLFSTTPQVRGFAGSAPRS